MFVLGMKMFFRARNLDSLEKYFEKKQDCISTLSWFDKVIELDRSESWLNPEHIEEIRNTIRDIEYLSKMLLGPLARFGNLSKELGLSEREVMRKFMSNEFDWTVEYIENFRTLLSRWMEVHEKEIRDETNTLKQKNIREFGGAIERLNIQSEALEKVKVSL